MDHAITIVCYQLSCEVLQEVQCTISRDACQIMSHHATSLCHRNSLITVDCYWQFFTLHHRRLKIEHTARRIRPEQQEKGSRSD